MVWTQEYQLFISRDRPGEGSLYKDYFDYLSGSHLQSQVKTHHQMYSTTQYLHDDCLLTLIQIANLKY